MPTIDRDGAQIWYDRRPADGPRALLLMGLATSSDAWAPQLAGLPDLDLLRLDARGVHRSGAGPVSVEALAADAAAALDAVGWSSAHVVGFSMGGMVAAELAARRPDRVRSLTLACVGPGGLRHAVPGPADLWRLARVRLGRGAVRDRAWADMLFSRAWQAAVGWPRVADAADVFRHARDDGWLVHQHTVAFGRYRLGQRLPALPHPLLVVGAGADRVLSPAAVRDLRALVPRAAHLDLPDAGHAVTWEAADAFNAAVRAHIAGAER
jgi:pimeloyl-ACP methyl ester carboxylesterase